VFGSKFFPYTWDTRQNKFDPKTVLCIFVGYSDKHKGYKCFHPSSRNVFISCHMVFNELFFSFKTTQKQSMEPPTSHVISIFYSWLPQIHPTRTAEPDSQALTPSATIHLPHIPSLTFVSSSVTGSSSDTTGQQQLQPTPALDMTQTTTQETP